MGDRTLLGTDRHVGTIIEWKGKFGWIQPTERVDHPMAGKRGGKVYLSVSDVEEELEGVGAAVSFLVYEDPSGLGAMAVRPADELEQQCVAAAPQPQGLNQHGQTGGGCGKKAGKGGKGGKGTHKAAAAPSKSLAGVLLPAAVAVAFACHERH
mmetsp:Transcript_107413/g.299257  ORF Transcript_107413/g.299257 Transcript_107413/m.299257 type:complete len:153 (-) Transcript_107413:65-523(-)